MTKGDIIKFFEQNGVGDDASVDIKIELADGSLHAFTINKIEFWKEENADKIKLSKRGSTIEREEILAACRKGFVTFKSGPLHLLASNKKTPTPTST